MIMFDAALEPATAESAGWLLWPSCAADDTNAVVVCRVNPPVRLASQCRSSFDAKSSDGEAAGSTRMVHCCRACHTGHNEDDDEPPQLLPASSNSTPSPSVVSLADTADITDVGRYATAGLV